MIRTRARCVLALLFCLATVGAVAQLPPLPVFEHLEIQAVCTYDAATQKYRYDYTLTNPAENTAEVWVVVLSLGVESSAVENLSKPAGWSARLSGQESADLPNVRPPKPRVSWCSSEAGFSPGQTSSSFGFLIAAPPSIREAWVKPWLDPYFDAYLKATGYDEVPLEESIPLEDSYIRKIPTLGPLGVSAGSFEHWDTFISDVAKTGQLGWVQDASLLASIQQNLQAARQAALAQDQATVNAKLQAVIDAISAATPGQRTSEGYALVLYSAQYLQRNIPWPCEPKLSLAPAASTHSVGESHTATATLVNMATNLPIANNPIWIDVKSGPNAGIGTAAKTDAQGRASLAYVGMKEGEDTLIAHTPYGEKRTPVGQEASPAGKASTAAATPPRPPSRRSQESALNCTAWDGETARATVKWSGGPDLVIRGFVPPLLVSAPGRIFYVTETTANEGNLPVGPSVTRYYLSLTKPVDPATAMVVGERSVPGLAPGEASEVTTESFGLPASLPAGTYYLDACADAEGAVAETNEANNCASNRACVVPAVAATNRPPDCTHAAAVPGLLWPPNHKLQPIAITGVTDPEGDAVTIVVTAITQDEPTNGLGDGDTSPDGFGVGTASPQVRAERSGTGNGRVYRIAFTASDGRGGTCSGAVTVGVPHDKKDTPLDDGQNFDSAR